jgi:hypothetical protein
MSDDSMMMDEPSFDDFGGDDGDSDGFSPVAIVCTSPKQSCQMVSSPLALWHHMHSLDFRLPSQSSTNGSVEQKTTKPKAAAKKAPAPKAPKTTKAPKATKAPAKKLVQATIKATKPVTKKRPMPDSDDEDPPSDVDSSGDISMLSNTPPEAKKQKKAPSKKQAGKPLQDIANDSMNFDGPSETKETSSKTVSEKYQKLSQLEHIIKRPDTYIGSVERTEQQMWVFNSETSQMEFRKVSFVPGLYKIFDEILVNAADNKQNDPNMKSIKVQVNRETGEISVENDGAGIPIEIHQVSSHNSRGLAITNLFHLERESLHSRDDFWSPFDWV